MCLAVPWLTDGMPFNQPGSPLVPGTPAVSSDDKLCPPAAGFSTTDDASPSRLYQEDIRCIRPRSASSAAGGATPDVEAADHSRAGTETLQREAVFKSAVCGVLQLVEPAEGVRRTLRDATLTRSAVEMSTSARANQATGSASSSGKNDRQEMCHEVGKCDRKRVQHLEGAHARSVNRRSSESEVPLNQQESGLSGARVVPTMVSIGKGESLEGPCWRLRGPSRSPLMRRLPFARMQLWTFPSQRDNEVSSV